MNNSTRSTVLSFLILIPTADVLSSDRDEGKWVTNQDIFIQLNSLCTRAYECKAKKSYMYPPEQILMTTGNKLVQGVCGFTGGKCACTTAPPDEPCEVWFETKE